MVKEVTLMPNHLWTSYVVWSLCDGISEEEVEEEVRDTDQHLEEAESPVEQPHLVLVEPPDHAPWVLQAAYGIPHGCAQRNSPHLTSTLKG